MPLPPLPRLLSPASKCAILSYDAILALIHKPAGLGTWILLINAALIVLYFVLPLDGRNVRAIVALA